MNAYVIKNWYVSETPPVGSMQDNILIEGRAGGLLSWLLSLIGISPTVKMAIGPERTHFAEGSLEGSKNRIIPIENVCSTFYGYAKPWKEALILGALLAVPTFGFGIILAVIYYYLNKCMTVGFVEVSGVVSIIAFKRSVIEGVKVDVEQARQVAELTQKLIEARESPSAGQ